MRRPVMLFTLFLGTATMLLLSSAFATKIKPENKRIKVVCIDAGHGGKDPGCHGDNANEKDVALAIALKFGKYIETHYPDIKVVYTRKTDVFVELNERAAIANRNHADLFICIHCNSACVRKKGTNGKYHDVCNEEAHGSETYVMGLHKANGNLDVAMRENSSVEMEDNYQNKYDLDINSDEAEIIYSTYQNIYLEQSTRFAELCQQQFASKAGRDDKAVKQAGFLVLWKTSMPSVLIETGFLSNPEEERFLSGEKGQTTMAACIFRAFRGWKDEIEGNEVTYNDDIEKMKPYQPDATDTAGLRKPVNYIAGGTKPANNPPKPKQDSVKVVTNPPKPKVDSAKLVTNPPKPKTDSAKIVKNTPVNPPKPKVDSSKIVKNTPVNNPPKPKVDSSKIVKNTPPKPKVDSQTVVKHTPKSDTLLLASNDHSKVPDPLPPSGPGAGDVVYRVQIVMSDKPLSEKSPQFKGVTDIWHYEQKGAHKYTTGTYTSLADAVKRQNELRAQGFDQAFVVAFDKDGNRITIDEAKKRTGGK